MILPPFNNIIFAANISLLNYKEAKEISYLLCGYSTVLSVPKRFVTIFGISPARRNINPFITRNLVRVEGTSLCITHLFTEYSERIQSRSQFEDKKKLRKMF